MAERALCLMLLLLCSLHYIRGQTIILAFDVVPVSESVGITQVCMSVLTAPADSMTNVTVQITAEEADNNPAGSEDFSPSSANLSFPNAGTGDVECFNLTIIDDEVVEVNEDIRYVATTTTTNVAFASSSVDILIDDNDLPIFSVANASLTVMENAETVMICVNLTGPSGGLERSEEAQFVAVPGTALTPQDFNIRPNPPLRVTFESGTMVGDVACGVVEIENDFFVDGNKQFVMMLEENSAYMLEAPLNTSVTIEDDEIPTLNINVPASVNEGNTFDACVSISIFPVIPVTVTIGISGDTNDEDFNVPSTEVVLNMMLDMCVTISVETDNLFEGDEPFSLTIISASVPAIYSDPAMSIVIDAENITVGFVELQQSFPEDSSTTRVCVQMVDIPSAGTNVSVVVFIGAVNTTIERCNIAGYARTPEDYYIGTNVTFPITAGNPLEECIDIFIVDDTFAEVNETIQLQISSTSPSNVILQNTTTEITILDDDVVTFSIPLNDSVVESDETFLLAVNISGPATNLERDINITVQDFPGTAIQPDDYNFSPLTLSFLCFDNRDLSLEDVELVTVTIENDSIREDNETFNLMISASVTENVIIESNEITVTIIDDEFSASFTLMEAIVMEGGVDDVLELEFVVIEGIPTRETVINITIVEVTVTSDDYTLVTPTITLGPETLQATVTINITNDLFTEQDEFLQVIASSLDQSVDILNSTVNVTIDSDDTSMVFLNSSVNVTEGEIIQVCVNVEGSPLGQDLYVELVVLNDTTTASSGDDFIMDAGSLIFHVSAFTTATCEDLFTTLTDELFEATESVAISILTDSFEDVMAGDPCNISIDIINTNVVTISVEPMMLTIAEMNGQTAISANLTVAPNDTLAVDIVLMLDFAMSEAKIIDDFITDMEAFFFPLGTMSDSVIRIMVNAVDDEVLEGNQDIVFNILTDVLPGLYVTIVNNTIEIIDDEVMMIQFVENVFNFTEGSDQTVEVCFAPVQIPLGGYSIPIEVYVSVVSSSLDSDECSGSGLANSSDFTVTNSSMFTFPPNSTTELCLMIDINDDNLTESRETFSIQITVLSFTDNVFAGNSSVAAIYDNDNITVIVSSSSVDANENAGTVSICSELSAGRLCTETSIGVVALDVIAISPDDYVFELSNITYFPGFTVGSSSCVDVIIIDDMLVEVDEPFTIMLVSDNPLVETVSSSDTTTVNIIGNDAAVRFANDTLFVNENDVVSVCAEIFDGQLLAPAVVHINFTNITTSFKDFSYSTKYFSLDSNTTIDCIDLNITADMIKEIPEMFSLTLFETEDTVVVSDDVLNITIMSDDVAIISFVNETRVYVEEGNELTLCVELSGAALSQYLTIQLMADDGPVAFVGQDFNVPAQFEVTFAAGSSIGSQDCIAIGILDDESVEGTHNFSVSMIDPGNPLCTLGSPSEIEIAIIDNDIVDVTLSTDALTITEGMSSNLTVLLEVPSGGIEIDVSVTLFVTPLTGEEEDVTLSSETVVFTPAIVGFNPSAMVLITVTAVNDGFIEMDIEDILVSIANVSVIFRTGEPNETTISVVNINGAGIAFTEASQSVDEDEGNVTVCAIIVFDTNSTLLEDEVNVTLKFMEGSATGGQDYVVNNTIVFPAMSPSNSQECVMVEIVDDQLFEDVYELFDISLDNISISEVVVATPTQQQVTIVDNDIASFEVAQDVSVLEDAGNVSVCVILNGPAEGLAIAVTLNADSENITAVGGSDYEPVFMQSLTFPAKSNVSNSQCVQITIIDDFDIEGNETFQLTVADTDNRTIIDPATSIVDIIDNDLRIMFLNDSMFLSFAEMEAPIFTICFEVIQGIPSVDYLIFLTPDPNATAIRGSDYNINENPFVINSTVLNGCIDVEVLDDDFFENDDFVSFTLTSPTNGVQIVNGFLNITIENDDFPEFEFNNTKYIVNETSDTQVCVRTLPDGARVGPDVPTTVVLTVRNRTAIEGTDFSFDSGFELLFDGTSSVLCVPISIIDDGLVEFSEYFLVSFDYQGSTDEVEVIIHDPDVCPNVAAGPVCEDSIFLRVCNTLRKMNGSAPRPCDIVLEEYTDLNYQP